MKVFNTISEIRRWSLETRKSGMSIGLVPTMGFLHEGHLSLIRKSRQSTSKTVVSIFVNPAQFAPHEDFDKYPKDMERDLKLCELEGVDVVFAPAKEEIYLANHQTFISNEKISQLLCGKSRPIHFKGVTTIVTKLFNIVEPDVAVFGQKDAQQSVIIKNMVQDLNFKTHILIEPIVREPDGLAMSSRNKYLTPSQRKTALILYQSIRYARQQINNNLKSFDQLIKEITNNINSQPECKVDYVEFVNAETLQNEIKKGDKVLFALAVFIGDTRLIDNIVLDN